MSFHDKLQTGKVGESLIARWVQSYGCHVLPVYEKLDNELKGPVLHAPDNTSIICPDMLVMSTNGRFFWIEAKHKQAFTLNRKYSQARGYDVWNTGIDLRHYKEYLRLQDSLPHIEVWLMFLHQNGTAKDTPDGKESPSGLFGSTLNHLRNNECHRHPNWGRSGMVYWEHGAFKVHVPLQDFYAIASQDRSAA